MPNIDKLLATEWIDSLDAVVKHDSVDTAKAVVELLNKHYEKITNTKLTPSKFTSYVNTISAQNTPAYPGNPVIEKKISALIRWNAAAMVLRANKVSSELGGHIASYASSAFLYEVGFNHFWRAPTAKNHGDLVFFQGHSSPGIYARSFVEGRFSEDKLNNFRQEAFADGLSSYPHPWLMPDYWSLPTVSMGLGPLMAIYQARFMHYLDDRDIASTKGRKVWCFIGDGETSEPETLGNIHIASRENLDNLIFVVNCNLQRLDGPVNGNGKIIQELDSLFNGANWKVIKVVWGKGWDKLLSQDTTGKLQEIMMNTVDGEYQDYRSKDGAYIRKNFFGKTPETLDLVSNMTDTEIWSLTRGGHDLDKVYAAYSEAVNNPEGKPVVILAKTIKGYGMSGEGESQNVAHNQKKLSVETLKVIRDKFNIPINDADIASLPYLMPQKGSEEYDYLHARRDALGGYYPQRKVVNSIYKMPSLADFSGLLESSGVKENSTTMAFVRVLNILLKDKNISKYIVPIVPDESRTFGMEGMFRQYGIWNHFGQLYTPEDSSQLMYYKESVKGQILQEGINEPGAMSSWIAAATSYANNGVAMIPFYIYYSMFGFQRIGDLAWAAGDMRARGFMIGGTSGRTTLNGEGLQHEDGHSHIQAGLIPNCESYDPTFAYEVAVIVQHGLHEMYIENKDKFYYITLMNENYAHPAMPANVEKDIVSGAYIFDVVGDKKLPSINLMGSGSIFRESIAAATILSEKYGFRVNLISATSFNKLRRDGMEASRENLYNSEAKKIPHLTNLLNNLDGVLTVATTDYIRNYADQVREYVPHKYVVLGTDGFGRSDYRKALRDYFEIDAKHIVYTALYALYEMKLVSNKILLSASKELGIDTSRQHPWNI